jgi:hypothetical protein
MEFTLPRYYTTEEMSSCQTSIMSRERENTDGFIVSITIGAK